MSLEIPPPPEDQAAVRPETGAPSATSGQDRGVSPIAGRIGGRHGRLISLAALGVGCGVFLFATWDRGDAREAGSEPDDAAPRQLAPFEPARRQDPPLLENEENEAFAPTLTDEAYLGTSSDPIPADSRPVPSPSEQRRALADSAQRAPVLAYSRAGGGGRGPLETPNVSPATAVETGSPLDGLRRLSPIRQARAGRLPDRNHLITAGSSLPCILQTAMDSATPGYVSCLVSRDVYSDNGAVVLLERGTRVLGEYRGGLEPGRRRLFVLWTRAVTPAGVAVSLASPAADAVGRTGFDGAVDTHFWDRFGGALLLSVVDDAAHAAIGGGQSSQSAARLPSDAATVALQGSIGIPSTLGKSQGSEVSIFVAQDLDFSDVYALRPR